MDKMREEFEDWWRSEGHSGFAINSSGNYIFSHTKTAWISWKASRAALCVELPRCWNDDQRDYRDELVDSMDQAGVSYK